MMEIVYKKKELNMTIDTTPSDLQSFLNFALLHVKAYNLNGDTVKVESISSWFAIILPNLTEPIYFRKDNLSLHQTPGYYIGILMLSVKLIIDLVRRFKEIDRPAFSRLNSSKIFNLLCSGMIGMSQGIHSVDTSGRPGSFNVTLHHNTLPRPIVTYDNGIFYHYVEQQNWKEIEGVIINLLKEFYRWK